MMFNYEKAFSRNVGWITEGEQQILRHKRIAIAGLGGVGGFHLLTLARLAGEAETLFYGSNGFWPGSARTLYPSSP